MIPLASQKPDRFANVLLRKKVKNPKGLGVRPEDLFTGSGNWQASDDPDWTGVDEDGSWNGGDNPKWANIKNMVKELLTAAEKATPEDASAIGLLLKSILLPEAMDDRTSELEYGEIEAMRKRAAKLNKDAAPAKTLKGPFNAKTLAQLGALVSRYNSMAKGGSLPPAPVLPYITKRAATFGGEIGDLMNARDRIDFDPIPASERDVVATETRARQMTAEAYFDKQKKGLNYGSVWGGKLGPNPVPIRTQAYGLDGGAFATADELKNPDFKPGQPYTWDNDSAQWVLRDNWVGAVPSARAAGDVGKANGLKVLNTKINQQEVAKFIPPIVQNLISANAEFVSTGVGPVGKTSFPLYVARYQDPLTGQIRTLPKPSSKYVNPRNLQDVVRYYEARVLAAWNGFVRCEQNLFSLYNRLRNGQYVRSLANKTKAMHAPDAEVKISLRAIQNLMKDLLSGKRPYGMPKAWALSLITLYQQKRYEEIEKSVRRWGLNLQKDLPSLTEDELIGTSIKAKYAESFPARGLAAVNSFNKKLALPQLSKTGKMLELYGPDIQNAYIKPYGTKMEELYGRGEQIRAEKDWKVVEKSGWNTKQMGKGATTKDFPFEKRKALSTQMKRMTKKLKKVKNAKDLAEVLEGIPANQISSTFNETASKVAAELMSAQDDENREEVQEELDELRKSLNEADSTLKETFENVLKDPNAATLWEKAVERMLQSSRSAMEISETSKSALELIEGIRNGWLSRQDLLDATDAVEAAG